MTMHVPLFERTLRGLVIAVALAGSVPASAAATPAPERPPPEKRVVLIGATARSAPAFIRQALALGYNVTGIARHPEDVEIHDPRLSIVKGDVYDEKSIEAALTGNEAVVSYLACCRIAGVPHGETPVDIDVFSKGLSNVIQAMKAKGNRRLVAVSSTSVEHVVVDQPGESAPMIEKMAWNGRHRFDDQRRMEAIIVASGLDYTIVRPARVTGDVSPGTPLNVVINKISYDPYHRALTRPDLAAFILGQLDLRDYFGSVVGVYN